MPVQFEVNATDRDIASEFESAFFDYLIDGATVGYNHSLELAPEDDGPLKSTSFPPERRGNEVVYGYTAPYAEAQDAVNQSDAFTSNLREIINEFRSNRNV